jgi:hypothetical protein
LTDVGREMQRHILRHCERQRSNQEFGIASAFAR